MSYKTRRLCTPYFLEDLGISMRTIVLCLAWLAVSGGCSGTAPRTDDTAAEDLNTIVAAYQAAAERLGRPPGKPDELSPHLPEGTNHDSLFDPFVIVWGTDPQDVTNPDPGEPLIFGYARESHGGMRLVATAMGVYEMEEQQFQNGNFPTGHRP